MPELDQRLVVQPYPRDVAGRRFVDQRLGGGAERPPLRQADEALQLCQEVETLFGLDEVVDQAHGKPAGGQAHALLPVAVDHVVLAGPARAPGLAARDVGAGLALQLQRDVLGHVPKPGSLFQSLHEAARPA